MIKSPKISVIVPVYNAENYIEKCLLSIKHQTLKNIEIIVIDDGSTDNSLRIINKISKEDNRVKVYHQKNKGLYRTREIALSYVSGEYIGWVDSDDFVEPEMYETLFKHAKCNNSDLVYCNYSWFPDKVLMKEKWFRSFKGERNVNFVERNSQPWNKIVKRSLLANLKVQNYFTTCFDEIYIDVLLKAKKPISINEKLYHYRINNGTMSSSYDNITHYIKFISASKNLKNLLSSGLNDYWRNYLDYRIIYYYLIAMLISAKNSDNKKYRNLKKALIDEYPNFRRNQHYKNILNVNYGKLKAIFIGMIVPNSYMLTRLACSILLH